MASQLTLAGFPLLHDGNVAVQGFCDRMARLADLRCIVPHVQGRTNGRVLARNQLNPLNVGYPLPQWPERPQIRLNQLYWPTGASRWAEGYFLANEATKESIVAAAYSAGGESTLTLALSNELLFSDRTHTYLFQAEMHLLPPRPIPATIPGAGDRAWLIPLVDSRYYWQRYTLGDFDLYDGDGMSGDGWRNFDDLIVQLQTQLGIEIDFEDVPADFERPDPASLEVFENAATMLDAVAFSIGRRVVRWADGTVKMMTFAESDEQLDANMAGDWWRIYGGDLAVGSIPEKLTFVFQKMRHYRPCVGEVYTYETDNEILTDQPPVAGVRQVVYSSMLADFSTDGSTPDNQSTLDGLADAYAETFYGWLGKQYDQAFVGAKDWNPSGYDDHVLYTWGAEYGDPEIEAFTSVDDGDATTVLDKQYSRLWTTRVQTFPHNFSVEHQLSQDYPLELIGPFQWARTQSTAPTARSGATYGTGTVDLQKPDGAGDLVALLDASDTQMTVDVDNLSASAMAATEYIAIADRGCGHWTPVFESCGV